MGLDQKRERIGKVRVVSLPERYRSSEHLINMQGKVLSRYFVPNKKDEVFKIMMENGIVLDFPENCLSKVSCKN